MSKILVPTVAAVLVLGVLAGSGGARDRPFGTTRLIAPAFIRPADGGGGGLTDPGGPFSKSQIERFRCASAGNPVAFVDISCNTTEYGQDWAPDNEIAVAVDPTNPNHIVAGSNDYFYRFNNSTGARQALVPTGFFTSFDGGASWIDGQIPLRSGNGAGDPAPGRRPDTERAVERLEATHRDAPQTAALDRAVAEPLGRNRDDRP